MNIGILGPPGAGKTKFANRLRRLMGQQDHDHTPRVKVVDGYAQRIQRDTGLALGPWANWSETYMVAGYRRVQELRARKTHEHVITVGTILDSVYYCGLAAESMAVYNDAASSVASASAMAGVGIWFRSDWDYDLAFILGVCCKDEEEWVQDYAFDIAALADQMQIATTFYADVDGGKNLTDEHIKPLFEPATTE